jgi:hypothetical protein
LGLMLARHKDRRRKTKKNGKHDARQSTQSPPISHDRASTTVSGRVREPSISPDPLSCLPKRGRRPRRVSCSVSPQKNHWASIPLREATCWSPRRDSSRQHAQAPTPKRDAPRGAATAHAWPDRLPGRRALPPLSSLIRGGCHHALVDAIGCSSGAFRSIWGPTCPASTPADSPGRRGGP